MVGGVVARIVETEAYRQDDPASHSFRGPTKRNVVMFGPPGFLYMYFIYGMHWCTNVVTGPEGSGEAVLLRAATIEQGIEIVRDRRPKVRVDRALADGPGKLSAALGLSKAHYGLDVLWRRSSLLRRPACAGDMAGNSANWYQFGS